MEEVKSGNREIVDTAFALGGLAGHNFHGLGFLQSALTNHVEPDMISCTSGQIFCVWKYLLAKNGKLEQWDGVKDLEALASHYASEAEIKPSPAYPHIRDVPKIMINALEKLADVEEMMDSAFGYIMNVTLNNIPARLLTPDVQEGALQAISDEFNNEDEIAIAFNSYNPKEGIEHVYLNPKAQDLLQRQTPKESTFRKSGDYHLTEYRSITPEAVLQALWIYEYGFEEQSFIDGAYFRQIMLAELSRARTICVARPVRFKWEGELPVTHGDKEDLKTEVFFNGAYSGERFRIELMNRLIRKGALDKTFEEQQGYHTIEIKDVPIRHQKPFVGYFSEDIKMFNESRNDADECLKAL